MVRLKQESSVFLSILFAGTILISESGLLVEATGGVTDFVPTQSTHPAEYVEKFYTENKIDGLGIDQKCAEEVLNFRKNRTITIGVEPTVGLGAALLIFLLVGAFAAGIAQAFQMVNYYILLIVSFPVINSRKKVCNKYLIICK